MILVRYGEIGGARGSRGFRTRTGAGLLEGNFCAGSGDPTNNSCKGPDVAACMQLWRRPNGSTFLVQDGYCYEPL